MANKKPPKDYTLNAVYVTPCKDCKSSIGHKGSTVICLKGFGVVPADHYCSYGERKKKDGK